MHKLIPNRSGYYNRLKCILFLKLNTLKYTEWVTVKMPIFEKLYLM